MKPRPFILRNEGLRKRVMDVIAALDISVPWQVTVQPYKRSRSLEQNNLYWRWLGVIAEDTGYTADDIHEFCKAKFLPPHFVDINGEVHETRRTTTNLKVGEMSEYMDRVYAWATGELGMGLPLPEEMRAA